MFAALFLAFFCLLREAEYILNTYLTYHIETLCMYTTVYILNRPPAVTKGSPPTTMPTVPPCGYNYVAYRARWMLGKAPSSILTGAQSGTLEIEHTNKQIIIIRVT